MYYRSFLPCGVLVHICVGVGGIVHCPLSMYIRLCPDTTPHSGNQACSHHSTYCNRRMARHLLEGMVACNRYYYYYYYGGGKGVPGGSTQTSRQDVSTSQVQGGGGGMGQSSVDMERAPCVGVCNPSNDADVLCGFCDRRATRTSGFKARMQTPAGRKVLQSRRKKGRKVLCPCSLYKKK